MKIITAVDHAAWAEQNPDARTRVLELANDADPAAVSFDDIDRIPRAIALNLGRPRGPYTHSATAPYARSASTCAAG